MPIVCHGGQCIGGAVASGNGSNTQTGSKTPQYSMACICGVFESVLAGGMLPEKLNVPKYTCALSHPVGESV